MRSTRVRARTAVLAVLTLIGAMLAVLAPVAPAAAEPATTVRYPGGSSATRFTGYAFDTCTAPPVSTIRAWNASPYRAIAVYFGGNNRACAQPQLTAQWVRDVTALGWKIIPVYLGRQATCTLSSKIHRIDNANAAAQGAAEANDAIAKARALGFQRGSALYNDMENYAPTDVTCRTGVLRYLSGWTKTLHAAGWLSGVYAHPSSGARDLANAYTSTSYARPDALWIARWDGVASLTGWPNVPDSRWANHQRVKQYRGDHLETWGGVTLNIDSDRADAPVATVARSFRVTSSTPLNARSGPSTSYPVVRTWAVGATLAVVCQAPGQLVGSTAVWDRLTDGSFVSDRYVSTPSSTTYSGGLARCTYPFQTTAAGGLTMRTGPSASTASAGSLPNGSLAWVTCQRSGTLVGTTRVWDRLDNGRWVTDYYVATPSSTSWSAPVPRC